MWDVIAMVEGKYVSQTGNKWLEVQGSPMNKWAVAETRGEGASRIKRGKGTRVWPYGLSNTSRKEKS